MIRAHFKHCALCPPVFVSVAMVSLGGNNFFLKVSILFSLTYLGANLVCVLDVSTSNHPVLSKENFGGKNIPSLCVLGHVAPQ